MTILHITSWSEWLSAQKRGLFTAASLLTEGFIHCSTAGQVVPVADAFYRGQSGLVLLVIEESLLEPELRWEPPAGTPAEGISPSDLFPHIYGPVNVEAVVKALDFPPNPSGLFSLPALH